MSISPSGNELARRKVGIGFQEKWNEGGPEKGRYVFTRPETPRPRGSDPGATRDTQNVVMSRRNTGVFPPVHPTPHITHHTDALADPVTVTDRTSDRLSPAILVLNKSKMVFRSKFDKISLKACLYIFHDTTLPSWCGFGGRRGPRLRTAAFARRRHSEAPG